MPRTGRYPLIPIFETIPGETPNAHGTRALAHAMQHGTATLADESVEQAIRFATIALASPGIHAPAADTITKAVHALRAALRHRTALDVAARARVAQQLAQPAQDGPQPGGGQRTEAPRTPPPSFTPPSAYAPPAPRQTPVARPQHAEILF